MAAEGHKSSGAGGTPSNHAGAQAAGACAGLDMAHLIDASNTSVRSLALRALNAAELPSTLHKPGVSSSFDSKRRAQCFTLRMVTEEDFGLKAQAYNLEPSSLFAQLCAPCGPSHINPASDRNPLPPARDHTSLRPS